jgi:hypothetical protein
MSKIKTGQVINEIENKIVLYTDKRGNVELRADVEKDTMWATQVQIGRLFEVDVRTVNEHLKNIFKTNELKEISVIRKFRIAARDGKQYLTNFYNLDAIIAVGYRVNSKKATRFRIWATGILHDYLVKGYILNRRTLAKSKESLDGLHEAMAFIESRSQGKPLKAKMTLRLTKDLVH